MFLLIFLSIILKTILVINGDELCNCEEVDILKQIVQKILLDQTFHSAKLRKIEASIKSTQPLPGATNDLAERLVKMETTMEDIGEKLEAIITEKQKGEDERVNMDLIVKKALTSEKIQRIQLISDMKNRMADLKYVFENFKADINTRMDMTFQNISLSEKNFNQSINEKLEEIKGQTENLVDKVLSDVSSFQDDFKIETNEKVKYIKIINQSLLETDTKLTALDNIVVKSKIDGGWTLWGGWSSCSVSCGSGVKYRSRTCSSPSPSMFGRQCEGNSRQTDSCGLKSCPDHRVAFTAYGIDAGTDHETVRFPNIIENIGNSYSRVTGKFTCRVPGIYHFAVTLAIRYGKESDRFVCNIYLNSKDKIEIYVRKHNHDSLNSFPASVAGVFHLNLGDTVYIGNCEEYNKIYNDDSTVFTGVLISADV